MKPRNLPNPAMGVSIAGVIVATSVLPIAFAADGNWNVDAAGNWSTATNWSSNPTIPDGAGSVVGLTNNITVARTVTIDATSRTIGTLNIGDFDNTHAFTLAAGAGLSLTFNNSGSGAVINETGSLTDIVSAPIILADNLLINAAGGTTSTNGLTLSGIISESGGARSITVGGSGSVNLSGANTYTGGTTLSSGQLHIGNDAALGTGTLTINGGTIIARVAGRTISNSIVVGGDFGVSATAYNNQMNFSGNVDLGGAMRMITVADTTMDPDTTFSGALFNGGLNKAGAGRMLLTGNNSYTGNTTITAGTLTIGGAGRLGGGNYAGAISNSGVLSYQSTSAQTLSGSITGSGSLTKGGTATLTLSGANNYSGGTTISNGGGVIAISHGSALGTGAVQIATNGSDVDAKLQLSGGITVGNAINMAGVNTVSKVRIENVSGVNTLNGAITFNQTGGGNATISSTAGKLNLTGGMTTTLTGGRTFAFSGAGDIEASGAITNGTATVAVTKDGAGKLTLSGTSTYTGTTTVSAGSLYVNGALGTSAVTANGGTFGGTGLAGGNVTINAANFAAGSSAGSIEIAGDLNLGVGSTTQVELGGTNFSLNGTEQYDRTKLTGITSVLTLGGGALSLSLIDSFTLAANQAFGIIQLSDGATRNGTFGGLASDGSLVGNFGGIDLFISYSGNFGDSGAVDITGGNDVVLYTVPEPAAVGIGCLGLALILRRRRV